MSCIVSRFTRPQRFAQRCGQMLHVLLILFGVLQMAAFADGNSETLAAGLISPNPRSQIPNPKSELPSALEILAQVRANFPREMIFIKGQILSGGRLGKLERICYVEMLLDLGRDPALVRYRMNDAFGTPFEQMTISVTEGCEAEFEYETGNPLRPAACPPPAGMIKDTDVTWSDLSLLFLWRTDARTLREESLRGRDCYVLEFSCDESGIKTIWIDMQMLVLLQMEELDADGRLQRRLTIKNIKKISDQWMIKNMEIRAYPALHHTLIRIDEVITRNGKITAPD